MLIPPPNPRLDRLITDDHIVFLCKLFQPGNQVRRLNNVNDQETKKQADHKGEGQILGEPGKSPQNIGVNQKK